MTKSNGKTLKEKPATKPTTRVCERSISANIAGLEKTANWVRREIVEMTCGLAGAHLAPSFSCTELLVALYKGGVLRVDPNNQDWEDRDRFILSKGQGCLALYPVLADMGFFPVSELRSFCRLGSRLGAHSESNVPGVEAFTGSLGHGLSLAAGMALAAKIDKKSYTTVALLGDGECQEGSIWEAAMFAAHYHLDNLVVIVDRNTLQAIDFTEKAIALEPFQQKWEAFGWDVATVNGHFFESILPVFNNIHSRETGKPLAIIARTTKGKGVSFMESNPIWHYRTPVGEELDIARKELSR
jgi:transketolase